MGKKQHIKSESVLPREVFGERIKQVRTRRGWRQQDLADRLLELGHGIDRSTIAKIERGQSRADASITDVFAFALALGVAPVHLLIPLDSDATVQITSKRSLSAGSARVWVRGQLPLKDADLATYLLEMPEQEARRFVEQARYGGLPDLERMLMQDEIADWSRQVMDAYADENEQTKQTKRRRQRDG